MAMMVRPAAVLAGTRILAALGGVSDNRINIPGPFNSAQGQLDYLLGRVASEKSAGKGKFFADIMGFSDNTLDAALRKHLNDHISSAVRNSRGHFEVIGEKKGPGGVGNVKTVWQVVNGKFQFITAHPFF